MLKFLGHAGFLYETKNELLLMDPWMSREGAFDNSEDNPMNPDPSRSVPWGQMSEDEMFFGAFTWKNIQGD